MCESVSAIAVRIKLEDGTFYDKNPDGIGLTIGIENYGKTPAHNIWCEITNYAESSFHRRIGGGQATKQRISEHANLISFIRHEWDAEKNREVYNSHFILAGTPEPEGGGTVFERFSVPELKIRYTDFSCVGAGSHKVARCVCIQHNSSVGPEIRVREYTTDKNDNCPEYRDFLTAQSRI